MLSGTIPDIVRRTTCRVCGGADLHGVLSLGPSPLANAFLESEAQFAGERFYPLDVYVCGGCSLVQLLDVVSPARLFSRYLYTTGTSETMVAHCRSYAHALDDLLDLREGDLVVEVASNDGTFLKALDPAGVRTLGIEPAANLAALAAADGVETVNAFFTASLARDIRRTHGAARAVVANNVLAHVDDPHDFLGGCRDLVADHGLIAIEVPCVADLLDNLEYDTIYHEHLSYFSVTSLLNLCDRAGLTVVRLDRIPVHGGSLRVYLSAAAGSHAPAALAAADDERRSGLTGLERYRRFADDVRVNRARLIELLDGLTRGGRRVAGYGAPAKASTLLNYCGIGPEMLPYTVDRNPTKVGLFMPGTHIPVRAVSALEDGHEAPDDVLILAWNVAGEIVRQQQAHRSRGGRFLVPVPKPRVL